MYSRFAGLGFVALAIIFLVISVYDQFIVFEVDSVVAFLAAIVLLFRDPRARVQASVLDATQASADRIIQELTRDLGGVSYVPTGAEVKDVVLSQINYPTSRLPNITAGGLIHPLTTLTPPGRGLAELYSREAGLSKLSIDGLSASLQDILCGEFGIARSAEMKRETDDQISVILHEPSFTCTCSESPAKDAGSVGCIVASSLAVLVSAAAKRRLSLSACTNDADSATWSVTMRLAPNP